MFSITKNCKFNNQYINVKNSIYLLEMHIGFFMIYIIKPKTTKINKILELNETLNHYL